MTSKYVELSLPSLSYFLQEEDNTDIDAVLAYIDTHGWHTNTHRIDLGDINLDQALRKAFRRVLNKDLISTRVL